MYVCVDIISGPVPNLPTPGGFPFKPPSQISSPGFGGPPQLVPTKVWAEYHTSEGKIYFYNKITKQSVWEKPPDFELIMPLPPGIATTDSPVNDNKGNWPIYHR